MKYLYEDHMGGIYFTERPLNSNELYCKQCGDSDWPIGSFETIKDFWSLIKDNCDIDGCGGWSLQYIYPFIVNAFDLPDVVECDDYGICSHSDAEIITKIEELIKEKENECRT